MPKIEIEDVRRLNVKPGDVLLVTVPQESRAQDVERIRNAFENRLPITVIVKTAQVEVEVITEAEVAR